MKKIKNILYYEIKTKTDKLHKNIRFFIKALVIY